MKLYADHNSYDFLLLLYLSNFSPIYFPVQTFQQSILKMVFPSSAIQPIKAASSDQGVLWELTLFNLSLLPQCMEVITLGLESLILFCSGSKLLYYKQLSLMKKLGIEMAKPLNPYFLMLSTYCHYFHTLLIPSKELTFPLKPFA